MNGQRTGFRVTHCSEDLSSGEIVCNRHKRCGKKKGSPRLRRAPESLYRRNLVSRCGVTNSESSSTESKHRDPKQAQDEQGCGCRFWNWRGGHKIAAKHLAAAKAPRRQTRSEKANIEVPVPR